MKSTIDEYLLDIQQRKSIDIKETIGDDVLEQRETVNDLLNLFNAVPDSDTGGFILIPDKRERRTEEDDEVIELDD